MKYTKDEALKEIRQLGNKYEHQSIITLSNNEKEILCEVSQEIHDILDNVMMN